jgi:3'-phosphoadenosine 5'-phosphosulfate sulfotransferase (PAPS reductase)/FAD synthetase
VIDPFMIRGPALISFSGGRTSGYMLWRIIQAHGGTLPDDVVVVFANTGKEREETLLFVQRCGDRWGVPISWVELLRRSGPVAERYELVDFFSASRNGEPFARLIAAKKFTPNAAMRFCTEELKVKTIFAYLENSHGITGGLNVIGLRHDEGHRLLRGYAKNETEKSPWTRFYPLDKARVTRADVMEFWSRQNFDLELRGYEGNCDLCFLKGRNVLRTIMRENPGAADWWIEQERVRKGRFVTEFSYADLAREVSDQPHMFDDVSALDAEEECGMSCGAE